MASAYFGWRTNCGCGHRPFSEEICRISGQCHFFRRWNREEPAEMKTAALEEINSSCDLIVMRMTCLKKAHLWPISSLLACWPWPICIMHANKLWHMFSHHAKRQKRSESKKMLSRTKPVTKARLYIDCLDDKNTTWIRNAIRAKYKWYQ